MERQMTHPGANESPQFVKLSLASAMTLDLVPGRFYRGATNPCINLLLTYDEGCSANCSYCGLARERAGKYTEKSFINVDWPTHPLDELIRRMCERERRLKRVCLSMITNPRARQDSAEVIRSLSRSLRLPLSVLISPTIMRREHIASLKEAGAGRIGIAVDAATEQIFDRLRGKQVGGPHRWDNYWSVVETAAQIFGPNNIGIHLMAGIGETEAELVQTMRRVKNIGAQTHLFSFFAEKNSAMRNVPQPPMGQYRRMQLARHIIETFHDADRGFIFDEQGRLVDFGLPPTEIEAVIAKGEAFMTSGCPGRDGKVACNRPYGNCLPGPDIRNYPFKPDAEDLERVRSQISDFTPACVK
jgi:biotin synthase-related radical SAM superfamily protein